MYTHCFELLTLADRLRNFIVGVTNTSPTVSEPVRGTYPLCGQYPYQPVDGTSVAVHCSVDTPPGQYVIIQSSIAGGAAGALTICELEVYGCDT